MPAVSISQSALADLEAIQDWYLQQGVAEIGLRLSRDILERIQLLETHPELGRIVPEFSRASPHFSPGDEMIAQGFGFTRGFVKEWNNNVYFRLNKTPCGFKEQARARQSGEKCGPAFANLFTRPFALFTGMNTTAFR